MEIMMRPPHLLDPNPQRPPSPAQLVGLRLGPSGSGRDCCAASRSADGEFIIRPPLVDCGSRVTEEGGEQRSPEANLDARHLSLKTDDWSCERNSPVYFMIEMVNILASVDHHHHPPLRLYAGSCLATLTPDSHPRYPFIDHQECFTDSQLSGSGSRFLPRVRDDLLHIQLEPFLFHQDRRLSVSAKFKCSTISISAQI
ncbi:zona pellucida sperm-binding protein 3-like [Poeciliopsis prolifica]|uniref:zona pellucida sperm-binding protein 3-like n=1 Tax=Poeciliopsis prolifica TaxID=188132 RepID=UPI0024142FF1|nr:zona pellucida sperm-binding protein 3-like [Poeciliopsis prolifica]